MQLTAPSWEGTFLTPRFVSLVDEQEARALGAEGQGEQLEEGREAGGGEEEGPVVLTPEQLPGQTQEEVRLDENMWNPN